MEPSTTPLPDFDEIYKEHRLYIYRVILRFTRNIDESEDLTQSTFLTAFRQLSKFRGDAKMRTWLHTIALNLCRNHYNKHKNMTLVELDDRDEDDRKLYTDVGISPEARYILRQSCEHGLKALERFQKEAAVAFNYWIDGKEYQEIAAIMGCPIGTVRSRIFRAREFVKHEIERKR